MDLLTGDDEGHVVWLVNARAGSSAVPTNAALFAPAAVTLASDLGVPTRLLGGMDLDGDGEWKT